MQTWIRTETCFFEEVHLSQNLKKGYLYDNLQPCESKRVNSRCKTPNAHSPRQLWHLGETKHVPEGLRPKAQVLHISILIHTQFPSQLKPGQSSVNLDPCPESAKVCWIPRSYRKQAAASITLAECPIRGRVLSDCRDSKGHPAPLSCSL